MPQYVTYVTWKLAPWQLALLQAIPTLKWQVFTSCTVDSIESTTCVHVFHAFPKATICKTNWTPQKSLLHGSATFRIHFATFKSAKNPSPQTIAGWTARCIPSIRPASFSAQAEIHRQQQARRIHCPATIMRLHRQGIQARCVELHRVPKEMAKIMIHKTRDVCKHETSTEMYLHTISIFCVRVRVRVPVRVCLCACVHVFVHSSKSFFESMHFYV